MKRLLFSVLFSFTVTFLFSNFLFIKGNETRKFNYNDFDAIDIGNGIHLIVTQSQNYSIEVKGDSKDLDLLKVLKKSSVLKIFIDRWNYKLKSEINVYVKMPSLNGLDLHGGAYGDILMDVKDKPFSGDLSGNSALQGKLEGDNIILDLSGGSRLMLKGKAKKLKIIGSEGSIFEMKSFTAEEASAALYTKTTANITVNKLLNTKQSGSSKLTYYGKAQLGKKELKDNSIVEKGSWDK